MTWQWRNVLVSTHFWNPPKQVIGPTKYRTKHIYKLTLHRTYLQNLRSVHVSTSVTTCLRAKVMKWKVDISRKKLPRYK